MWQRLGRLAAVARAGAPQEPQAEPATTALRHGDVRDPVTLPVGDEGRLRRRATAGRGVPPEVERLGRSKPARRTVPDRDADRDGGARGRVGRHRAIEPGLEREPGVGARIRGRLGACGGGRVRRRGRARRSHPTGRDGEECERRGERERGGRARDRSTVHRTFIHRRAGGRSRRDGRGAALSPSSGSRSIGRAGSPRRRRPSRAGRGRAGRASPRGPRAARAMRRPGRDRP